VRLSDWGVRRNDIQGGWRAIVTQGARVAGRSGRLLFTAHDLPRLTIQWTGWRHPWVNGSASPTSWGINAAFASCWFRP